MFWRKNWHWLLALIVVFGVGGFILFKPKTPVTVKKVYKVPDFSQVRKDKTSKGGETPAEQTVAENTETPVEKSADPVDDSPETPLESPGEKVSLEDVENTTTPEAKTDDWQTGDYGESPYGFGPYPQIPSGFPEKSRPIWTFDIDREGYHERLKRVELLNRVRIKLWKEGHTNVTALDWDGATNKVYALTSNTAYIEHREGKIGKKIHVVVVDSNFPKNIIARIEAGEKPPGYRILDYDSGGFDVYEFLGLNP